MAKTYDSALKRHKQSEVRHSANKAVKTSLRTSAKKFLEVSEKNDKDASGEALKDLQKRLDTAARKGIIPKNAAARKKSRMQKRFNTSLAATPATEKSASVE
jgi:small subunit ribosomal protein S20